MNHSRRKKIVMIALFFIFLFIDQTTKYVAMHNAAYQLNTGISLNLFSEVRFEFLSLIQLATLFLFWLLFKNMWHEHTVLWILLFSGSISNLTDRLLYNGVVDWIFLPIIHLKNNLADIYIFLALIGVCFFSFKDSSHANTKDKTTY